MNYNAGDWSSTFKGACFFKGVNSKIVSLVASVAELPKNIPAGTIYAQIEKLLIEKTELEGKRNAFITRESKSEQIIKPMDYEQFLVRMMRMVKEKPSYEARKAVLNK